MIYGFMLSRRGQSSASVNWLAGFNTFFLLLRSEQGVQECDARKAQCIGVSPVHKSKAVPYSTYDLFIKLI
jgi:hypothetical protein